VRFTDTMNDLSAINRRAALLGLAGASIAAARPALAADPPSPLAHGFLANNPIASAFEPAPPELPHVDVLGRNGTQDVSALLKGRTILMPIWAEWCAPCMSELPDFAMLQNKYANAKFAIIPVMSGMQRKWTSDRIGQIFQMLHATVFEPLMEDKYGSKLFRKMALKGGQLGLPCNILIAPNGRVVARELGRIDIDDAKTGAAPPNNGDPETLRRAEAGQAQSLWGKQPGEKFAAVMAAGFFD